jgi:hypothetical protein
MDTYHYSISYHWSNLAYVTAQLFSVREAFHVRKCIRETSAIGRVRKIERKNY